VSAFDPARLEALADVLESIPAKTGTDAKAAVALRAFAQVVRVLEHQGFELDVDTHSGVYVAVAGGFQRGEAVVAATGSTPLAAVLALAEVLAKEGA
jgi:hypothetical protein